MEREFDFNKVNKKMPYTVPDNFFEQLESNIWEELKTQQPIPAKPRKNIRLIAFRAAFAMAAAIALFFILNAVFYNRPTTFDDVEQAFSKLSQDDQNYMIMLYQDDEFINN